MSLFPGFNKGKETSFLKVCMANFGCQRGAPSVQVSFAKEIFSFLYRMVLFLSSSGLFFLFFFFFFYFTKHFFSALDFSVSKDFSISKELHE